MFLFIDETEDDKYFLVGGILVPKEDSLQGLYKKVRSKIKHHKYSMKAKNELLTELKDYQINKRYRRLKKYILQKLSTIGVFYYCMIGKKKHFKQVDKERTYIKLLKKIIKSVNCDVNVVYDDFKLLRFHNNISVEVLKLENVISVNSAKSQECKSLQFSDIVVGTIRRYYKELDIEMYKIISAKVIDI